MTSPEGRWRDYVLARGDDRARAFWTAHLSERERAVLFVVGCGFDPRSCHGPRLVLAAGGSGTRDLLGIQFLEGEASPSLAHRDRIDQNWSVLSALFADRGRVESRPLECLSAEGRRVTSQRARALVDPAVLVDPYTDVVIDVSAMPRSVFFPLVAGLLALVDSRTVGPTPVNLFVMVSEDPALDADIRVEGVEEKAEFMASFTGGFDEEATTYPKVWVPVLGEQRGTQFGRILDLVKPDEVCPVLPSPARNPRRGDDIVVEYQRALFDELRLDPRGFLYASEDNPFEVYRRVRTAALHYNDVFRLLGGCKVALSALSSKLMSLGVLLVAYELKRAEYNIGVAHIECQGYTLPAGATTRPDLFTLWLAGECYAP